MPDENCHLDTHGLQSPNLGTTQWGLMMSNNAKSFDPVWDDVYQKGQQLNRYPFEAVIAFVFKRRPRNKKIEDTSILEVGCGAGNNLWFGAREGFQVAGVDASSPAIDYATRRFREDNLKGDFRVGDFTRLPFNANSFDLAINRAALTQAPFSAAKAAINEVHRCLRQDGLFFSTFYADRTTAGGRSIGDGLRVDLGYPIEGVGQTCYYDRDRIERAFEQGWSIEEMSLTDITEFKKDGCHLLSWWTLIARKVS